MNTAAPVGQRGISKRFKGRRVCNFVSLVVAIEVASDLKVPKLREGRDGGIIDASIKARESKV